MAIISLSFVGKTLDRAAFIALVDSLPKPLVITGPSGSGKSFVLNEILTRTGSTPLDMDALGTVSGGKFNVDVKALRRRLALGTRIFVGTCSNFGDVVRSLKPRSIFILDLPGEEYWERVAMKFHDGLDKDLPESMLRNFGKLVAMEPPELSDYINARAWRVLVQAGAVDVDTIEIRSGALKRRPGKVTEGWHTPSKKKGGSQ
jgi:hypothetical protein